MHGTRLASFLAEGPEEIDSHISKCRSVPWVLPLLFYNPSLGCFKDLQGYRQGQDSLVVFTIQQKHTLIGTMLDREKAIP